MNKTEILERLQGLLERQDLFLTEEDKQLMQHVCHILTTEPEEKIDWITIIKLIIEILSFTSHLHH